MKPGAAWGYQMSCAALLGGMCGVLVLSECQVISSAAAKRPIPPEQVVRQWVLPAGFRASVFAAEPLVRQPIALCWDDRGRLWVVENLTYADYRTNYDLNLRDRIVIFTDEDSDGHCDGRKVFWDQGQRVTSVAVGFGGVWVLAAPHLLFIPDRDGDDKPDGEPLVLLDGWDSGPVRHNIVNGLKWGPDGWLYGRHGIQATSFVGKPGTPREQRMPINCAIWRYHPTRHVFEVVCRGTTNPWGWDFNEYGDMFFINTVIGHLWHAIPGAHYRRMYGEDFHPHLYELIDQHADHYHWDTSLRWDQTREATGQTDKLGGGHAHAGLMIYLGDNWPEAYRGRLFTLNLHGRRINQEILVRHGSGYVGRHAPDFCRVPDSWFRGIELLYGPDGGVFVADWSDTGECHEDDGVDRDSGRIYKIVYGQPRKPVLGDVSRLTDAQLVELLGHRNDWYVRQALRNLQERAATARLSSETAQLLHQRFRQETDTARRLRILWAIYVTENATPQWLNSLLEDRDEYIRAWAVRLLTDREPLAPDIHAVLQRCAERETSAYVRLYLTAALQRLPIAQRPALAEPLLRGLDATDHNLPLLTWYGIEPVVAAYPDTALRWLREIRVHQLRRFIVRRLASDWEHQQSALNEILRWSAQADTESQRAVLRGIQEAIRGWQKVSPPAHWKELQATFLNSTDPEVRESARQLAVVFGDGRTRQELLRLALDSRGDGEARRAALRALLKNPTNDLLPVLKQLLHDRSTAGVAAAGLAYWNDADIPGAILASYPRIRPEDRPLAIGTLASRPAWAWALLQAVAQGRVAAADISPYHARQIASLGDEKLVQMLRQYWGEIRHSPEAIRQQSAQWKTYLNTERLQTADLTRGRALFGKLCSQCHRLHGEGQVVGPDLTGAHRDNLDYLLENLLDPSAVVPADFRMSVLALKDGRVITGVVVQQTDRTLAVQTQQERLILDRQLVEQIKPTSLSLMPDNLLQGLAPEEVRDLIGYLMSRTAGR
ncbi:MAG: c-type cytochrome [Gemmatales bacterium]|nr:c-type cytochrome [Gemmatales bacterium]MCS7161245.1 c-type cytochrome [Gemmatales bacterium]MDW8176448.1 c-type cytochrome [Gemmatales bacterium]MDW8222169.1 c-type cytochrome [Gemmatales bacterium]